MFDLNTMFLAIRLQRLASGLRVTLVPAKRGLKTPPSEMRLMLEASNSKGISKATNSYMGGNPIELSELGAYTLEGM